MFLTRRNCSLFVFVLLKFDCWQLGVENNLPYRSNILVRNFALHPVGSQRWRLKPLQLLTFSLLGWGICAELRSPKIQIRLLFAIIQNEACVFNHQFCIFNGIWISFYLFLCLFSVFNKFWKSRRQKITGSTCSKRKSNRTSRLLYEAKL